MERAAAKRDYVAEQLAADRGFYKAEIFLHKYERCSERRLKE